MAIQIRGGIRAWAFNRDFMVFGVSTQVRHKPAVQPQEMATDLKKIRKKRGCIIYVAKTKELISCTVTGKLICTFAFAYAKAGFLMMQLI